MAQALYPWSRLTYPKDVELTRDLHGWVSEPGSWQNGEVRPLSYLRDQPVVVVLGERGFGKSDALTHEAGALGADGRLLDLATVPSASAAESLRGTLTAPAGATRHVLLDGLDDAPAAAEIDVNLAQVLGELNPEQVRGLYLRLSCRTSRWPELLTETLTVVFGAEPVIVHMAGLTRRDAVVAARERGVSDVEEFVAEIERRRLVPLAARPVTFLPLLDAWVQGRALPETMSAAYAQASLHLCSEKRPKTLRNPRPGSLPAPELAAVAGRVAGALQFCAREFLAEAPDLDAVALEQLVGGIEPLEVAGGEAGCSGAALEALTESGLLAEAGPGRWAFTHRSFREYLAAQYLGRHAPDALVRDALLMVGNGPTRRPVTRHREVAAWLAVRDREVFEDLLICDPAALLLGDLAARPAADRVRVVDALSELVRAGTAEGFDRDLLRQLEHDAVAERIAVLLAERGNLEILNFALKLAESCPRPRLAGALLDVAEDEAVPEPLRAAALAVLSAIHDRSPDALDVDRLRALMLAPQSDVAALALTLLWPQHLSTRELLDHLPVPPAYPHPLGQAGVLRFRLPRLLKPDDLLPAAEWSADALIALAPDHRSQQLASLAVRLLAQIIQDPAAPADPADPADPIITALAHAMAALASQHPSPDPETQAENNAVIDALRANAAVRRAIGRAVLEFATTGQIAALCRTYPVQLFPRGLDAPYYALHYPDLPAERRKLLREVLAAQPIDPLEAWDEIDALRQAHPELAEMTMHWYQRQVSDPASEHYREGLEQASRAEQERHARVYDEAALRAAIADLASGGAATSEAWYTVLELLHRTANGDPVTVPDRLDLTGAPGMPPIGSALDDELAAAAALVVAQVPAVGATGVCLLGQAGELCALALLTVRGRPWPELTANRWAQIAAALMCLQPADPEDQQLRVSMLGGCVERAGAALPALLPTVLDRLDPPRLGNITDLLPPLPAPVNAALVEWADARGRDANRQMPILSALARYGDPGAAAAIGRILRTAPSGLSRGVDSRPVARWLLAAQTAVQLDKAHWPRVLTVLERHPHLAEVLLPKVAHDAAFGHPRTLVHELTLADLERLFEFVAEHGPGPAPLPSSSGFARPGPIELRSLRYTTVSAIAASTDPGAVDLLDRLTVRYPDDTMLAEALADARRRQLDATWTPRPHPTDLINTLKTPGLRVVNDEHHLRRVVTESLARLQNLLRGENGWWIALWNEDPVDPKNPAKETSRWRAKYEDDLCDFATTFLRYDLGGRRVVVNREVEISRPGLAGSGRTDIQIHAHPQDPGAQPLPLTVVIEAKGCWNGGLERDLRGQLVERYLLPLPGPRTGIYLIGFFDDRPRWPETGPKTNRAHKKHTLEGIRTTQQGLADQARDETGAHVDVVVLDCRLPGSK